jgi:hypothetical protein
MNRFPSSNILSVMKKSEWILSLDHKIFLCPAKGTFNGNEAKCVDYNMDSTLPQQFTDIC